jgi:DNA recombination-dependent growth factor C
VRRVPLSLVKERLNQALQALPHAPNGYEKRQIKQRIVDELTPQIMPEKSTVMVMIDKTHDHIIIGSQSEALLDKVLRLVVDTFPGMALKPRWTKEAQRHAIKTAWNNDKWPQGTHPVGDLMLVHAQGAYQRIRMSGISELDVINDLLAHGYLIVGLRLDLDNGLSVFMTPTGHFQGIRYPNYEEDGVVNASSVVDWLELLELRAWVKGFTEWVHETA